MNLAGYPGHQCPLDDEGFLDFAKNLPNPLIWKTLLRAKPVSSISAYSGTDNFRRLFEEAPPPSGLCVIGDAACYFNPVNVRTHSWFALDYLLDCLKFNKALDAMYSSKPHHRCWPQVSHNETHCSHMAHIPVSEIFYVTICYCPLYSMATHFSACIEHYSAWCL